MLNAPHLAPIYTYKERKYLSLFQIIKEKGYLDLDSSAGEIIDSEDFLFCPPNVLIDREIKRIPFKYVNKSKIEDRDEFIKLMASAIQKDALEIESKFPDHTILLLVGGKDSMNLLLLPWNNPVLVLSAQPNYSLVKNFIQANNLNYDVLELYDDRNIDLSKEILINCCRCNLKHFRWTGHLKEICDQLNGKALLLLGQMGARLQTDRWKQYISTSPTIFNKFEIKSFGSLIYKYETIFSKTFRKYLQNKFFNSLWNIGAHFQGIHMSFLYEYLNVPVLSGYHGSNVLEIVQSTDYVKVVTNDLRPDIGQLLFSNIVEYPTENPGPSSSELRKGISGTKQLLNELSKFNIYIK